MLRKKNNNLSYHSSTKKTLVSVTNMINEISREKRVKENENYGQKDH